MQSIIAMLKINCPILLLLFSTSFYSIKSSATYSYRPIKAGDTIYSILIANKFSPSQIGNILSKKLLPSKYALIPGENYGTKQTKNKLKISVKFNHTKKPLAYVFWKQAAGAAGGFTEKTSYTRKIASYHGVVKGSLLQSLLKALPNEQVAYRFLDAYLLDHEISRTIQPKAKFAFTVEKLYEGKKMIRFGQILSTSLEISKKKVDRHLLTIPEQEISCFVDLQKTDTHRLLFSPVSKMHITSSFRRDRKHPIVKKRRPHLGIDFEQPEGAAVFPVSAGTVLRTGYNRAAGKFIVIKHKNNLESFYNHLQKIAPHIKKGQLVKLGKSLGEIGCTGYCTKPHLHFALKKSGRFVNPNKYLSYCPYVNQKKLKNEISLLRSQSLKKISL